MSNAKTENKLSKGQHRSGNASPNNTQIADKTRHGDKQHKPQPKQNLDTPWWAPIAQHQKCDGAGGSLKHKSHKLTNKTQQNNGHIIIKHITY